MQYKEHLMEFLLLPMMLPRYWLDCHPHSQNHIIAENASGVDATLLWINMEIPKRIGTVLIGMVGQMKKDIVMNGKRKTEEGFN